MSNRLNANKHFPILAVKIESKSMIILVKQNGSKHLKKQYEEELTALLPVVDGTVDFAASLLKAGNRTATITHWPIISRSYAESNICISRSYAERHDFRPTYKLFLNVKCLYYMMATNKKVYPYRSVAYRLY